MNLLAQALFYVNAAIWVLFAALTILRIGASSSLPPIIAGVMGLLMVGNTLAMLVAGVGIRFRHRLLYYFGIFVLAVNILLTFTDQFGAWDLITLIIDLALLGLLIAMRSQYRRLK